MGNLVDLEENRPHLVINTLDGNVHVVPVSVIKLWISGENEPDKDCVRKIIAEWLEGVSGEIVIDK